jgi:hypothetical protein
MTNDTAFWMIFRMALIQMTKAIEKYKLCKEGDVTLPPHQLPQQTIPPLPGSAQGGTALYSAAPVPSTHTSPKVELTE